MQRILDQKEYFPLCGLDYAEDYVMQIEFALRYLTPFQVFAGASQRGVRPETLEDVVRLWEDAQSHAEKCVADLQGATGALADFYQQAALAVAQRRRAHMISGPMLDLANFLHPGANKDSMDENDVARSVAKAEQVARYYMQELGFVGDQLEAKMEKVRKQLGAFLLGRGKWVREGSEGALAYWGRHCVEAPEMSRAAAFCYSAHPTEACVERSFSHQGRIMGDLRAQLSETSAQALTKVRFNLKTLCGQLPSAADSTSNPGRDGEQGLD